MTVLPDASQFTAEPMDGLTLSNALVQMRDFIAQHLGTAGTAAAALAALGSLVAGVQTASAARSVSAGDRGRLILCTGTWTLALGAATTLGAGFAVVVLNDGSGTITVDPAGSEQIDGGATAALGPGRAALVVCEGTGWRTFALAGSAAGATRVVFGTAAAPGLAFAGDLDSGLFRPAADVLAVTTGGAERLRMTNAGAQLTGLLTGTAVSQSATDTTAGRLPIQRTNGGIFGLGATGDTPDLGDYDATGTAVGQYRTTGATLNRPAQFPHAFGVIEVYRHNADVLCQVWHANYGIGGGPPEVWTRRRTGGNWTPWQLVVHLFEGGSNANGSWRRYSDGTQECEISALSIGNVDTAEGALFRSASATWTFPAAFVSATGLVVEGCVNNVGAFITAGAPGASGITVRGYAPLSIGTAQTARLRAKGFWK
jgi:hypothetical protein